MTTIVFDAGETLLNLDLPAIVRACDGHGVSLREPHPLLRPESGSRSSSSRDEAAGSARSGGPPTIDEPAVLRALALVRRDLDAFFLPHLAARRYPPQQAYADGRGFRLADLLLDHLGIDPRRRLAAAEALLALDRALKLWTVVPEDARSTLEALRARGVRLGVVSNSDGHIAWKLHHEGIGHLFDAILDSHMEGVAKPDPELFRRALERLDADPARTIYVGDIFSIDVEASRHAGLQGVLIDRSAGTYTTPPCPRVARLSDLLELV